MCNNRRNAPCNNVTNDGRISSQPDPTQPVGFCSSSRTYSSSALHRPQTRGVDAMPVISSEER